MKKKILIIIISILCLCLAIFTFTRVKADSGWDTSYDSGSDWGSSDWGSSDRDSSWDHDYSYSNNDYSSGSSSSGSTDIYSLGLLLTLCTITFIICLYAMLPKHTKSAPPQTIYSDVPDELLAKYGIDKEMFKQMIYDKYVDIQNAWMDFDYDKLKNNLTDELYNSYLMQLDILKSKHQKNIMYNYEKVDAKIIDVTEENNLINVKTYLRVWMYDYVIDENSKVLRGDAKHRIDIEYIIDWVREKDVSQIEKCPHCGAKVEAITGGVCSYCRAKVILPAQDYVMSRKMGIGQRRK